jgi:hypothetical protein
MNNNERVFIIIDGNNFYHRLKELKKKIEYIGFSHKPSYGLITHSDIRRLLTKDDLQQFFL